MVMAVGCPGIVIVVFAGSFAIASRPMGSTSVECIIAAAALVPILRIAAFRGWVYVYCALWQHWCGGKRTEVMMKCFFLPALVHKENRHSPRALLSSHSLQNAKIFH